MQNVKDYKIAFIESLNNSSYFGLTLEFKKQQVNILQQTPQGQMQVPQEQVAFRVIKQG